MQPTQREEPVDLKQQVILCLEALSAICPSAAKAGLSTSYEDAYDEWETVVQAIYSSFVLMPYCETAGRESVDQFRRLGFETDGRASHAVLVEADGRDWFIFDIACGEDGEMRLVLRPLAGAGDPRELYASAERCTGFRAGRIG